MTTKYEDMDTLELSCAVFVKILGWEDDGDSLFEKAGNDGPVDWFNKGDPLSYIPFPADSRDACHKAELKIKEMGRGSEYVDEMRFLANEEGCDTPSTQPLFLIMASSRQRCIAMLRVVERVEAAAEEVQ